MLQFLTISPHKCTFCLTLSLSLKNWNFSCVSIFVKIYVDWSFVLKCNCVPCSEFLFHITLWWSVSIPEYALCWHEILIHAYYTLIVTILMSSLATSASPLSLFKSTLLHKMVQRLCKIICSLVFFLKCYCVPYFESSFSCFNSLMKSKCATLCFV